MGNSQFFYIVNPNILLNRKVQVNDGVKSLSDWAVQLWDQWHKSPVEKRANVRNEIGGVIYEEVFGWSSKPRRPEYDLTLERDGLLLISFADRSLAFSNLTHYGLSMELLHHLTGVITWPEDAISNPGSIVFREGAGFPDAIDPRLRIFDFNCWTFLDRPQIEELSAAVDKYQQSLSESEINQRIAHPDWFWDMQFLSRIKTHQPNLLLYYGQC
jgi:hypothetical protein